MILVTGGTGKVGEAVVSELKKAGAPMRLASRSPRKDGPDAVEFDFDRPETFAPAFRDIDKLFLLTSGGTEREAAVVGAAVKAGVRHVDKLSVWGADTESFSFARAHRPIEKQIEASGLSYTFLRPNGYMQNFSTSLAPVIRSQGAFFFPSDFRHSIVDTRDVGAVGARALVDDRAHSGRTYKLSGPESLSNSQIAAKLTRAAGKPIAFVQVPKEEFRKGLLGSGMPEGYADAYLDLLRFYDTGAGEEVTGDVERVLGRKPGSFDAFARDFAGAWR